MLATLVIAFDVFWGALEMGLMFALLFVFKTPTVLADGGRTNEIEEVALGSGSRVRDGW